MPTADLDAELSVEHSLLTHETDEDESSRLSGEDASLASWLSVPEATEQLWSAAAVGSPGELLSPDWLSDRIEQRAGIAVTITAAEGSHEPVDDRLLAATPVGVPDEEAWEDVGQPRVAAVATDHAGVPEASRVDLGGALEAVWPQADGTTRLTDDELEPWQFSSGRAGPTFDDDALTRSDGVAGEQVVVVNVTGVDDVDVGDIAAGQYEAAQARRRFRAHVPG
jgi:hypothetical protein